MTNLTVLTKTCYYFLVGNSNFLLRDEPLEEVLRERVNYYVKNKKYIDFWILPDPDFLHEHTFELTLKKHGRKVINTQYNSRFSYKKLCTRDSFAIVSTNEKFITWLKLRLNNVWTGYFIGPTKKNPNPLNFNNTNIVETKKNAVIP